MFWKEVQLLFYMQISSLDSSVGNDEGYQYRLHGFKPQLCHSFIPTIDNSHCEQRRASSSNGLNINSLCEIVASYLVMMLCGVLVRESQVITPGALDAVKQLTYIPFKHPSINVNVYIGGSGETSAVHFTVSNGKHIFIHLVRVFVIRSMQLEK